MPCSKFLGRVIEAIGETGQLDNTLVFFVYGDNGTNAEGGRNGMFSDMTHFNGVQEKVEDMLKRIDKWGGPGTYPHMAAGWVVAFDTPYQWTKQVGSDFGGTNVSMAVHWPKGITAKGELRTPFRHVIDVAPTVLEAERLPEPRVVNGVPQRPMDGTSMVYSFNDGAATERHATQYFEPVAEDIWELCDTRRDFSLVDDLSAQHPEKLAELQALFMVEAETNRVLPIDDRIFSVDETADVGIELATSAIEAIGVERMSRFTGHIPRVTVEVHP